MSPKKSFLGLAGTNGCSAGPGSHINDDVLILALDGELQDADGLAVKEHLLACWSCRARKEQFARVIQDIVQYDRTLVPLDAGSAQSGDLAIFRARLDQLADELGKPSWIRRGILAGKRWIASGMVMRTALAGALLVVVIWQWSAFTRKNVIHVSAAELLQKAVASEPQSAAGINRPIAVQKLRIAVNGRSIQRTIYRDSRQGRYAHSAMENTAAERDVRFQFDRTPFGWDDALSAKAYRDWWQHADRTQDLLTKVDGNLLKLDTTTHSGVVSRGSLTVRQADFHPIAEEIVLSDNTNIEIAEISYGIVDLSSLSSEVFNLNGGMERSLNPLARVALPDAAQLSEAELQVVRALHGIGADLGEQITIRPTPARRMKVEGIVESERRKDQIAAAIAGIDFIEFRVRSAQQLNPQPEEATTFSVGQVIVATTNPPLLNQQLEQRFPNANQRSEFINSTVTLCETLTSRSWALKRLAERYTAQHAALLSAESQVQLQQLLTEQASALQGAGRSLQTQLSPFMEATGSRRPSDAMPAAEQAEDWRRRIDRIHLSAEAASEAALKLFAMPSQEEEPVTRLELLLRSSLTRLDADLQQLDLELHQHL